MKRVISYGNETFEKAKGMVFLPTFVYAGKTRLSKSQMLVYCAYASFDQEFGREPSLSELLQFTGMRRQSVCAARNQLEKLNYLIKIEQPVIEGYTKIPIPDNVRWDVWERDNFTCQKCGIRRFLSVDHIIPERLGGTFDLENLRTLCRSCNSKKGINADN